MPNNLRKKFQTELVPALQQTLRLRNRWQVPRVVKVVVNAGVGKTIKVPGFLEQVEKTLTKITGQKAVRTRAKKSISNFKIREGQEIGVMVTLRGSRMYDFLEKLLRVTLPRVRDFRGLSPRSFDGQGNYTLGFKEHTAFPEVTMEDVDKLHGVQVIVHTTARDPEAGRALLAALGFPLAKSLTSK
ncbi:MAG: 50S ribosomal protein L5 [Candidatus Magasanikbacteria bacterium]|nr:50S ribosomal protein L5 [Candidatus Magasanikbacteria bacterium]